MSEENFIRSYENAVSEELCKDLMDYFDSLEEYKKVFGRQSYDKDDCKFRSDTYAFLDRDDLCGIRSLGARSLGNELLTQVGPHLESYCEEFGLARMKRDMLMLESMKMQKVRPGQGYHTWHCEVSSNCQSRVLVWMFYCNTITEGGETEFLFQRKRFSPETGKLLIWPAYFTHTHRGGLVLGETPKYIVTGWLRHCSND